MGEELIWPVVEFEVKDTVDCTFQPTIGMARTVRVVDLRVVLKTYELVRGCGAS